jgi:hypothetical protein
VIERGLTVKNQKEDTRIRVCPKCDKPLSIDFSHSGVWGKVFECKEHGIVSWPNIVYKEVQS